LAVLLFQDLRLTAGRLIYWEARCWQQLTRLKTERPRLYRDAYSYSFYFFNPGMALLLTDSSQPVRSGVDEHLTLGIIAKDIKE